MLRVSEIAKNDIVRRAKARIRGYLCPTLSASFPEGIRDTRLAIPLIPKNKAMREGTRTRVLLAYTAKRVLKKAYVKEKAKRK